MMEFIIKNWLGIVSLLIALIGGIPGILNFITHIKSRAQLIINPQNLVTGNTLLGNDPKEYTHIIVSVIITNAGTQPLTPATFDLSVTYQNKTVDFDRCMIPPKVSLQSDHQNISVDDLSEQDLQKFNGAIGKGIPITGCLMFITDKVTLHELRNQKNIKLNFTCTDIFGKKYKYTHSQNLIPITRPTAYPKHALHVEPIKNEKA